MAEVTEVNVSRRGTMAEGEGGGKRGLVKWIIIAVVVLILLAGGTAGAFYFLRSHKGEESAAPEAAKEVTTSGVCPSEHLAYISLGSFVVNLADGRRYLKTTIDLMICDTKVEAVKGYLDKRMTEIKDLVVSELQTLNTEQLRDQRERELLRQRLLRRIESLLPNKEREWADANPIKKVLITEFYLQ